MHGGARSAALLLTLALGCASGARLTTPVVLDAAADLRSPAPEAAVQVASAVTLAAGGTLAVLACWTALVAAWCLVITLRGRPAAAALDRHLLLAPRLVRLLAGAALGSTVLAVPAVASPTSGTLRESAGVLPQSLGGLPLPDRPPGAAPHAPGWTVGSRSRAGLHTVAVGDSMWSIAADRLPPGSPAAVVDRGWRALYRANRHLVGDDPDLILPGTVLRLPRPLS